MPNISNAPENTQNPSLISTSNGLLKFFREFRNASASLETFAEKIDISLDGIREASSSISESDEDALGLQEMLCVFEESFEKEFSSFVENLDYIFVLFKQMTNMGSSDKYATLSNIVPGDIVRTTRSFCQAKEAIKNTCKKIKKNSNNK